MAKDFSSSPCLPAQYSQSPSTHTSLFRRFKSEDEQEVQVAWEEFYERYFGLIQLWAHRLQQRKAKTAHFVSQEDLAMKAVIAIGQQLRGDFRYDSQKGQFRGYLYRVVRNIRVNIVRKQFRMEVSDPQGIMLGSIEDHHGIESIDQLLVDELLQLFREALWQEIRAVRSNWRSGHRHAQRTYQAWWLCRVKEQPWDKIAPRLQVTETTAKKHAQRFHRRLMNRLNHEARL